MGSCYRSFYAGLGIISFCLLALEIIFTRALSVIFWYHYAFLIISVCLSGMTVGVIIVYIAAKSFKTSTAKKYIAVYSYLASLAIISCIFFLFYLPALFARMHISGWLIPVLYFLLSLPFACIGVVLCLSLTRFPEEINRLYGINLIGSALGALGIIIILNNLNAASAIIFLAGLAAISALSFSSAAGMSRSFKSACILMLFFCMAASWTNQHFNLFRPLWIKGEHVVDPPLYARWNFCSYLTVRSPTPEKNHFSWRISSMKPRDVHFQKLHLFIDEGVRTSLIKFNKLSDLEILKYDITSIANYLRKNDDVLVLGSGGGRDLLAAVVLGAKRIIGVEMNQDINDIAFNKFKDFTGSISCYGQIQFVVDEARSYVSRSGRKFDIIQAAVVDSFAALSNGAFALAENGLYTTEAWVVFLEHLKEEGILAFSRGWTRAEPVQIYRMLTLAANSLKKLGIENPREHIVILKYSKSKHKKSIGTILVSKSPFSDKDLETLERICDEMRFEIVLSPRIAREARLTYIFERSGGWDDETSFPFDISPPTDDRPFFFYFNRFKDIFSERLQPENYHFQGAFVLRVLLMTIFTWGAALIFLPLFFKRRSLELGSVSVAMLIYFAAIGLGFMLVEIAMMQRLGIFLGHPVYGLTVVLFSLLFSSGIGSLVSNFFSHRAKTIVPFMALICLFPLCFYFLPLIIASATPSGMPTKILISVLLLFLIGFFMGMPFPIGMAVSQAKESHRFLFWVVNGFASVCGSALAAVILINFGFQKTLLTSIICYLIALISLLGKTRYAYGKQR